MAYASVHIRSPYTHTHAHTLTSPAYAYATSPAGIIHALIHSHHLYASTHSPTLLAFSADLPTVVAAAQVGLRRLRDAMFKF